MSVSLVKFLVTKTHHDLLKKKIYGISIAVLWSELQQVVALVRSTRVDYLCALCGPCIDLLLLVWFLYRSCSGSAY